MYISPFLRIGSNLKPGMKHTILLCLAYFGLTSTLFAAVKTRGNELIENTDTIIVKTAIIDDAMSPGWKDALRDRMTRERLDSFGRLQRPLTNDEIAWKKLIESKAASWNGSRDSLAVPFNKLGMNDTIFVMLGFLGVDDGFTYGYQTVCLDITALYRAYGKAEGSENKERIDRIFAHEYTHLLHKTWAIKNNLLLPTFKDSILWECLYEGMGMYRSLNPKWLPVNDSLPPITRDALESLYPIFTERMKIIHSSVSLTPIEKERLHANLSRGLVNKKWGAFPVGIWLALEAKENPDNLTNWINKGPGSIMELAHKYLPPIYEKELGSVAGKYFR